METNCERTFFHDQLFQLTIGITNISGVTSYDQLDVRFRLACERVQRAHPELLNELSQRLPLVPSDEALEALATEHGWHASFFRPQALVLAKAPDSGDVGRLLMKAPAVASKAPAMLNVANQELQRHLCQLSVVRPCLVRSACLPRAT